MIFVHVSEGANGLGLGLLGRHNCTYGTLILALLSYLLMGRMDFEIQR